MSVNMERWRHIDGSDAVLESEHFKIVFQRGNPAEVGINGCAVEDVIEALVQKLLDFQGRDLACKENQIALFHLTSAQEALIQRRRRREEQGVIGTSEVHSSPDEDLLASEKISYLGAAAINSQQMSKA
jgi:hypothetical protein